MSEKEKKEEVKIKSQTSEDGDLKIEKEQTTKKNTSTLEDDKE